MSALTSTTTTTTASTPTFALPSIAAANNKREAALTNKVFCPQCKNPDPDIVEDYAKGDLICRECGCVIGDRIVDEHSEWRTFSNSESTGSDPNRVGGPTNPLLRDSGLSTVIGKGTSKDSSTLSRLQNRGSLNNGDRSLLAGFKEISRMAENMGLPQTVIDMANELFREMDDKKSMKGRSADGILAASLYIACRLEGIARTFKEICSLSNNVTKKELGRSYKMMKEQLANRISLQAISTEDFMTRFCTNLSLPLEVKKAADHVSRTAMELGIVAGKNPISVTAAAIYMVSQLSADKRTQKAISDISGVSEVTIRNAYKDLYVKRDALLPPGSPFHTNLAALPSTKRLDVQPTQDIVTATPSSQTTAESQRPAGDITEYVNGSIIRVKLHNFVTYSDIEFRPGPRLNVIIGPNGSGKSSIVCAIALGLGGAPNLLGRAKQVTDFIKNGCTEGYIEIELYMRNGGNIIVHRTLRTDNSSIYKINGRRVPTAELLQKMKEIGVQVDNLCQFLPQDKVVSFAAMSPTELLVETEKAIGFNNMHENHVKLIEMRKEQLAMKGAQQGQANVLEDLKRQNEALEKEVSKYQERKRLQEQIINLRNKLLWRMFDTARAKAEEIKKGTLVSQEQVRIMEKEVAPLKAAKEAIDQELRQHIKRAEDLSNDIKSKEEDLSKRTKSMEHLTVAIDKNHNDMDMLKKRSDDRKAEVARNVAESQRLQHQLNSMPSDESVKEKIDAKNKELKEINVRHGEIQIEIQQKRQKYDHLNDEVRRLHQQIEQLNNVASQKLETLRRSNQDVYKAHEFVQRNKDRYKMPILGPVCVEMNVQNETHARYLETSIPMWVLTSFVVQNQEDRDWLFQEIRRNKFRISVIYVPNPKPFERKINIESLKGYGIHSFLDTVFEAPECVMNSILDNCQLYNIGCGTKDTFGKEQDIINNSECMMFFTPEKQYSKSRSYYGDRNVSTRVVVLRESKFLSGVNLTRKNELTASKEQAEQALKQFTGSMQELTAKEKEFSASVRTLHDERQILLTAIEERKKTINRINNLARKIEDLSKEEDVTSQTAALKETIKKNYRQKVDLLTYMNTQIKEIVKVMMLRDISILTRSRIEAKYNAEIKKLDEMTLRIQLKKQEVDALKKEFDRAATEAKERKKEAEKQAPLTPEMTEIFENLPDEVEEIDDSINQLDAQAQHIHIQNPRIITEYENRKEEIQTLENKINNQEHGLLSMTERLANLRNEWIVPVQEFIKEINVRFTKYFENIGCSGETILGFNEAEPDNYEQYKIEIRVRFREEETLRALNAHVQSGGERSVSTMLFLISLQDLTKCPFRVVDEINQGMDPKNERMIFDQIVKTANRPGLPQYFLITPKLLPDLEYSKNTTVLCVFTGPWHVTQDQWEKLFKESVRVRNAAIQ
eukprot:gene1429-1658_t